MCLSAFWKMEAVSRCTAQQGETSATGVEQNASSKFIIMITRGRAGALAGGDPWPFGEPQNVRRARSDRVPQKVKRLQAVSTESLSCLMNKL
jgi:hypothetical protein